MPLVTAPIQPAHVRYQGLGVPHLDFEGSNKCVFGLYDEMAGVAEMLEPNCELHLSFSRVPESMFRIQLLTALDAFKSL
jgi:hypothetical protein